MEDIVKELAETTARSKSNTHRIDDIEKRQDKLDDLVTTMAVVKSEQDNIKQDVGEIKTDVKNLAEKPAKKWEALVNNIIWLVAGGLIAFAFSRAGIPL